MVELLVDRIADVEGLLRANRWIDADESIRRLSVAGEGNMNRTLRVQLEKRSVIVKQSVPFVAKYPQIAAPAERILVEAAFYRCVSGYPEVANGMPRVIGFDAANAVLALEDLGHAADFTHLYRSRGNASAAAEHLPVLLGWLSKLHHLAVTDPIFENRAMRTLNHAHIFEIPFQRNNGLDLDGITPGLGTLAGTITADVRLKSRVSRLGDAYLGDDTTPVLLHGDFYPGSWLHAADDSVRIIDPEFGFLGCAEFDVGVLLAHLHFAGVSVHRNLLSRTRGFFLAAGGVVRGCRDPAPAAGCRSAAAHGRSRDQAPLDRARTQLGTGSLT
ncbi:MAG: phosphotransferase [Gammaproteobacteria bacterium]|nr:phosphotransferase [Gammaproteobacteria bacterium]